MIFCILPIPRSFPVGGGPDFRTIRGSPPPPPPLQRVWMKGRLLSYGFAGPRQYMPDKYDSCVCLQLGRNVIFKKPMLKTTLRLFEGKDYHTAH